MRPGLRAHQRRNKLLRANGGEPTPGCGRGGGLKRWARYHRRMPAAIVQIENPERYLNAAARSNV